MYIIIFAGKKHAVKHQKVTANHKNRPLKLVISVLFNVQDNARIWGQQVFLIDVHLNSPGPVYPKDRTPLFSPPEFFFWKKTA